MRMDIYTANFYVNGIFWLSIGSTYSKIAVVPLYCLPKKDELWQSENPHDYVEFITLCEESNCERVINYYLYDDDIYITQNGLTYGQVDSRFDILDL